ncbi:MAG: hypothetical protein JG776_2175 [Caloramator sp.]|jgi:hypothetical protein|nr:hypothetical protein [Caloramator sp.]MBZ4664457.1 hypothetical protein [Caloramator sp.]
MLIQDRTYESIITIADYLFWRCPEAYIKLCNTYFGGNVRICKE